MATRPGTAGRENEDFVAALPGAVVLLDGAGIRGAEALCRHGTAWYTHRLGGALVGRLSRGDGLPLADLLAGAISEVTDAHRDTCDVEDPSSPQATVALFRIDGERADYLVLSDSFVVFEPTGAAPEVVTDHREVDLRRRVQTLPRPEAIKVFRANRNRPGGYFIAKDDPRVAAEAVTGSRPLEGLAAVALLSNGVANSATDWPGLLVLLDEVGPAEVIRRFQADDDATIAYCSEVAG
ncbi:protein phosphatase 2C domain-containing protein [Flindersiella endophytica]